MLTLNKAMTKVSTFLRQNKSAAVVGSVVASTGLMSVAAFADDVAPSYQGVITSVTTQLSDANLVSVLSYAVTAAIGFVFTWWAIRKCAGIIKRAFMRGKLRL